MYARALDVLAAQSSRLMIIIVLHLVLALVLALVV